MTNERAMMTLENATLTVRTPARPHGQPVTGVTPAGLIMESKNR